MTQLDLAALQQAFGFGVAGNFAGHLEQAGEAADFTSVDAPAEAPKGIFPWFVPGDEGFLGTFPLSSTEIVRPPADGPLNLQIEPEVGVLCDIAYGADGAVVGLQPTAIFAFNDCSIRREGAPKISHKKNWGPASKGVAATGIAVRDLAAATATFRLACFLRRDGQTQAYGVDSELSGYSYYGATLLDWIVERLANQTGSDDSPLENVGQELRDAGNPATTLIGIGATRYTELGESTYLEAGDEALVIVYDAAATSPAQLTDAVSAGEEDTLRAASVLRQRIV